MAVAVTGGQDSASGTKNNTDASIDTYLADTISIFTTPATSNAVFRVMLTLDVHNNTNGGTITASLPGHVVPNGENATAASGAKSNDFATPTTGGLSTVADASFVCQSELFVGPSTPINFLATLLNDTAAQAGFDWVCNYHYVATVIT